MDFRFSDEKFENLSLTFSEHKKDGHAELRFSISPIGPI
jgi:hypothetical protein